MYHPRVLPVDGRIDAPHRRLPHDQSAAKRPDWRLPAHHVAQPHGQIDLLEQDRREVVLLLTGGALIDRHDEVELCTEPKGARRDLLKATEDEPVPEVGVDRSDPPGLFRVYYGVVRRHPAELQLDGHARNDARVSIGRSVEDQQVLLEPGSSAAHRLPIRVLPQLQATLVVERQCVEEAALRLDLEIRADPRANALCELFSKLSFRHLPAIRADRERARATLSDVRATAVPETTV